jgi:hypothetical protein
MAVLSKSPVLSRVDEDRALGVDASEDGEELLDTNEPSHSAEDRTRTVATDNNTADVEPSTAADSPSPIPLGHIRTDRVIDERRRRRRSRSRIRARLLERRG